MTEEQLNQVHQGMSALVRQNAESHADAFMKQLEIQQIQEEDGKESDSESNTENKK